VQLCLSVFNKAAAIVAAVSFFQSKWKHSGFLEYIYSPQSDSGNVFIRKKRPYALRVLKINQRRRCCYVGVFSFASNRACQQFDLFLLVAKAVCRNFESACALKNGQVSIVSRREMRTQIRLIKRIREIKRLYATVGRLFIFN
jgi:hypothetical protein